ncbi:MAG: oxaloacetate decarboxylase gamma subunit [Cellvibrionaceae bacterium]|jgi:oxaloacetate decarboxylase gamma subunit
MTASYTTAPWNAALELMLLGMTTVFVFLTLLVVGTVIMSAVINKISPVELSNRSLSTHTSPSFDNEIAAVAAAAFAATKK